MQTFGGIVNDIIIFGIFIYFILIVNGKVKMRADKQEKIDAMMQRRGPLIKGLAYGGAAIFALLILIGIMSAKRAKTVRYSKVSIGRQWTKEDKETMTNSCILNAKRSYQQDSVKTREICACATESITSKYSYEEMEEMSRKTKQDQINIILPLINACKVEINNHK